MKLYKFKTFEPFNRIEDILTNNRFYLANWRELNDPMEGYFHYIVYDTDIVFKDKIAQFISNKNELKICSFSNTYHPVLLWTHYANQHKGMAIEVTLNSKKFKNLYRVKYGKNIPELNFDLNPTPYDVLSSKIKDWVYEREYRIIDKTEFISVGKITGIYFGINTENYNKERMKDLLDNSITTYDTKIDFNKNKIVSINST